MLGNHFAKRTSESIVTADDTSKASSKLMGKCCERDCYSHNNISGDTENYFSCKCNVMEKQKTLAFSKLNVDSEILWTREEKLLFWNVIEAHISNLLSKEYIFDTKYEKLFLQLKPQNYLDFRRCRLKIRSYLWQGRYRKGIRLYQYMQTYFDKFCGNHDNINNNLKELEQIFLSPYLGVTTNKISSLENSPKNDDLLNSRMPKLFSPFLRRVVFLDDLQHT